MLSEVRFMALSEADRRSLQHEEMMVTKRDDSTNPDCLRT